jgi:hypothetical protein
MIDQSIFIPDIKRKVYGIKKRVRKNPLTRYISFEFDWYF